MLGVAKMNGKSKVAAFLIMASALVPGAATAHDIGRYNSAPNESLDDFVVRLSVPALNYTHLHNVEVCGFFERTPEDTYSIELQTSNHPRLCDIKFHSRGSGEAIGKIFHTHAPGGIQSFSGEDFILPGYLAISGYIYYQSGPLTTRRIEKGRYKPRPNLASMDMPEEIPIFRR